MPADPLVNILLVNWNGRDVTLDCLASLRSLTYSRYRIVCVDNHSSDGSVQAIRERFPEVDLLEQQENTRFAGGNNIAIRHALGTGADLLCLLNNDTVVDPEFLTWLVRAWQSSPSAGMISPKILYHDAPDRIWYAGGIVAMWSGTLRHRGIRELDRPGEGTTEETGYATGCCLLTGRDVVEKVGGLDESFYIYAEDADWSLRARRAGYRILYEPRARVWHKVSVTSGGHLSSFKLRHKFASNLRLFARHASWYHWLTFPWMNLPVNGLAALRYLARRTGD
jgi:GT2 family glycosyltransferase